MQIEQVAIQLYTLRDFCKTSADYAATLKKVGKIGYRAIQISGVDASISTSELRVIADDEGLAICATHEPSVQIRNEPSAVVEKLAALGCKYTAYPFPNDLDFNQRSQVESLAADLDNAGAILHAAGQVLCYHNHAHEFARMDGKTVLKWIYELTSPTYLQAELDTYWVQAGGGDPVQWCRSLPGRLPLLHLKDYAVDATGKPGFAEIGSGNLDFKAIIAAAENAGCQWFIVEQDTCPGDPFDSIAKSFHYIQQNLVNLS